MAAAVLQSKILFISSYPPRKCGIASFTEDLVHAISPEIAKETAIAICALDKIGNVNLYTSPVTLVMDGHRLESCLETATKINNDPTIQLLCIEHEFGLYGGELGEYLLNFLSLIEKPFIIRFHTVLPSPSAKMLHIVQELGSLANRVVVMTNHSAKLLKDDYQVGAEKVIIIPHGTHANSVREANELKQKYDLDEKQVLTTFGLLSPNKGIEKGILAMKEISATFPDAVYIVLGQTHPNLLEEEGEKYRNYLQQLIIDNELEENVRLINEYAPTKKLMEYLTLTDIYLFTSKDPNQAVSGTFLYAMSAGCPIISNSFVLAKEMLDEKTGVILHTDKASELAANAIRILKNPELKKQMSTNAFLRTRNTTWEKVGRQHADLFLSILKTPLLKPELSIDILVD